MEKNVKVYFEDSGDIRRFLLRSSTQQELFKQLGDAIGSFWTENGKQFDMLYKDEENDLVKLSTPQEFEVCASCPSNREILRIFVRKSNSYQPAIENAAADNVVWKQVTCDKCGVAPLQGIRYKCILCPDYDECGKCFRSSPQHPHSMLALNDPKSDEWKAWLRHGTRRFGHHGGSGGPAHPLHHRGGGHGPRRCGGEGEAPKLPYPWMQAYYDAAKQFAEQMGGQSAASVGAAAASSMPGVSFTTCDSGHPKVEVDVDMNELLNQPGSVFQTVCRAVEEVGKMVQSMEVPKQQPQSQSQAATSSQTVNAAMDDKKEGTRDAEQPKVQQQDAEMIGDSAVVVGVSTVPTTADGPQQKQVPTSSASGSTSGIQTPRMETAANGWTLLSEAGSTSSEKPRKTEASDSVTTCIENLKELGFDTEKVWLRELVKQCQGDLNRVMDELTPSANSHV